MSTWPRDYHVLNIDGKCDTHFVGIAFPVTAVAVSTMIVATAAFFLVPLVTTAALDADLAQWGQSLK
jgi:hypothetical protein